MFPHPPAERHRLLTRRWFLRDCGVGLGAIALHALGAEADTRGLTPPGSPQKTHFPPRAKRVIYLFMGGAPSHLELFDHKPQLAKFNGTLPPPELLKNYRAAFINPNSKLLGPKFKFNAVGKTGTELSELLPHLAGVVDDVAIVKSMATDAFNHAPGQIMALTGSQQFGRPSVGAWVSYGLGSESKDLPGFVVFSSGSKGPSGGNSCWGSGFLPTAHAATLFRSAGEPVLYLGNPAGVDREMQRDSLDAITALNQRRLGVMGDPEIAARITAYEMAGRMQASAPELMDLSKETRETLDLYGAEPGKPGFANNCLLARRLVERGVRFVQLFHEAWDHHGGLVSGLKAECGKTDKASAALITDLKRRGLLDDTLVIWGGEFGRTPMVQGGDDGRDHHPNCYTVWLAGGGVKRGTVLGTSDDFGFNAVDDRVHVHDLNATILRLLGLDHEKLTFRSQGRDFRLTDVHGKVVDKLLA
ncbi:MAG: DUF1501 domain-containing protein [Gemmataceae bacterium]|nr:DUF1501 domain-containing protein [Gemmataceae bacterium]